MVVFVFLLDVLEDGEGLLRGSGLDKYLLEAALKGSVFFYILAVFVEGGGADALDFAACKGGLEHVGGIEGAAGAAGADDGVYLVYKYNDVRVFLQLVEHSLHAFLELAAVFGACHEGGEVERDDPFVVEGARNTALDDAQCQTLGNGAFAHAGFADEDGVVLFAAGEDLGDALQFLLTAYDGVELPFASQTGKVTPEVLQSRGLALGLGGAACRAVAWLLLAVGVGVGVVVVVLAGLGQEVLYRRGLVLGGGGGRYLALLLEKVDAPFVADIVLLEYLRYSVLALLEHGKEHVYCMDFLGFVAGAFEEAEAQNLLGLPQHGYFAVHAVADVAVKLSYHVFKTGFGG